MDEYFYSEALGIRNPAKFSDAELDALAQTITRSPSSDSRIPAGFTYLAQFIDHDISLDDNKIAFDSVPDPLPRLRNGRSPFFDLDSVYGYDAPTSNHIPVTRTQLMASPTKLKLGRTEIGNVTVQFDQDLLRDDSGYPIIVDKRNDENLAVAQIHVAFIRFHNAIVELLGDDNRPETFERARKIVIAHYQWIVFNEFLPLIIDRDVLDEVKNGLRLFYSPGTKNVMPLEFSVGAFRFGHSMIRNSYVWNKIFDGSTPTRSASVDDLQKLTGNGGLGNGRRKNIPSQWLPNWKLFFDIDSSQSSRDFNFASKIDTKISSRLGDLGGQNVPNYQRSTSLAALDLFRSRAYRLPSGQEIARRIAEQGRSNVETPVIDAQRIASECGFPDGFANATPIWSYCLYEAQQYGRGERLGPLGSRIVAETVIELIAQSPLSIFSGNILNDYFLGTDGRFVMADLIKLAGIADPIGAVQINKSDLKEILNKRSEEMTKIIDKINELHCKIYSDPSGEGGQIAKRLQDKAVKVILAKPDESEKAMESYMKEFTDPAYPEQLARLMGKDEKFNALEWADQTRAYLVSNSTCGIETGTGTRNNMTKEMIDSLDKVLQ